MLKKTLATGMLACALFAGEQLICDNQVSAEPYVDVSTDNVYVETVDIGSIRRENGRICVDEYSKRPSSMASQKCIYQFYQKNGVWYYHFRSMRSKDEPGDYLVSSDQLANNILYVVLQNI